MYKGENFNVFISYRGDSEGGMLGSKIYSDLLHHLKTDNEKEYTPFFAPACIPRGEDFKEAINSVLKDVRCMILVLNKGYFDKCVDDDDMVFYELKMALSNPNIRFIPLILPGFKFEEETQLLNLFDSLEIDRFKHLNPVNYHSIYDFKTEIDLLPVLRNVLSKKEKNVKKESNLQLEIDEFNLGDGKLISFGSYPQEVISDINLINKIATGIFTGDTVLDSNTNLLKFDDMYYSTFAENPFNKTKFSNGNTINSGSRNYYQVTPIKWIELYKNEEYKILISEKLIDAVPFNLSRLNHRSIDGKILFSNNWELSYIRRWLNNEFFYSAFDEEERNKIVSVSLENSKETSYHKLDCPYRTLDNVFLIAHKEIINTRFGKAMTTDYARARGAYSSTSASHNGLGDWWTRSPGNVTNSVENIDRRGCIDALPFCNYVDDTSAGVRPCIVIKV